MSHNERPELNETILRMVKSYKNLTSQEQRVFDYNTPTKRAASPTSSTDGSDVASSVKRFKADSDILCAGSPREFRRLKYDLIESRNYVKEMERQLVQMRANSKEEQTLYERETKRWMSQAERDRAQIRQLESRLDDYRQRDIDNKNLITELKADAASYRTDSEMHIHDLLSQLNNLKEEVREHDSDEVNTVTKLERKIEELQMVYNASKEEAEAYKKLSDDLTKQLNEKVSLENDLEQKNQALLKAQQQIKKLEFTKESFLEYQLQAKTQTQKLCNYESLERENQQLREEINNLKHDVNNKLLLEEEVHDLKTRLEKFKEQEKKLNTLVVTSAQTELHLEEFRSLARSVCETSQSDSSLPRLLRSVMERLQQQELVLTTEKIQLSSSLSTASHEAKIAKDELEKSRTHIACLDKDLKHSKTQMMRMHRKLQLVSGERDSYRKQLDSYEKDLSICMHPASSANPGGSQQMQSQFERIKHLEHNVEEYRDLVHKLEADLRAAEGYAPGDNIPIRGEQLARLEKEVAKLRSDNDLLRERKDKLEIQLEEYLMGQDNAAGRIVHNANNPLAELMRARETEKERLEEEVAALKRKIKKLEAGLEASRLGDVTVDFKEFQNMKEKLAAAENANSRLKDYFKSSLQEFRNVAFLLFGYKIDTSPNSQYKITSMYADRIEDQLCFQLNKQGAIDLLENQYSASLEELIELHLRQQGSIPVFLSSLTMDLFSNQSMTKPYEIDDDDDDEEDEEESDD